MKLKLLIILTFFVSILQAQNTSQRTNGTVTVVDPNLFTTRSFRVPVYEDTIQANTQFPTLDSVGKIIYTRLDNKLKYRGVGKWYDVSNSGYDSTRTNIDSNAYRQDLTLITDSNYLSFSSLKKRDTFKIVLQGGVGSGGIDSFAYRRDLTSITDSGYLSLGSLNGKDTFPIILQGSDGAGGSVLTYPYTTKKYLNGYGNFPSLVTDSITEGSINLFSKWGRTGSDIYYNAGKVFIGKTSGTYPLDVNGFISSTGGGISLNGDTTMAVSPTGYYAFGAYPHSSQLNGISIGKDAQSFFGYGVGTAGSFSVAIGNNTLRYLDNNRPYGNPAAGNFNTAIGDNIASNCQGCAFNTLIGSAVAQNLTGYPISNQGQSNIAIGAGSLPDITTGSGNIVLGSIYDYSDVGSGAGDGITTGGDNIIIGNGLSGFTSSLYNNILIGGSSTNPTFGANSNGVTSNTYGGAIASASIITPIGNLFHITGTTTITSISTTGIYPGTRITIIFDGALTLTDGSNLKLNGNFVTTTDDTITLACDGTNWYEVSRSTN